MLLFAGACGPLPPALKPVPEPGLSPLELERAIAGNSLRLEFADAGMLVLPTGDTIRGDEAAEDRLRARDGAGYHSFEIFRATLRRCSPAAGLETGTFRAIRSGQHGLPRPVGGRWWAEWRANSEGEWRVHRAEFMGPGGRYPPVDPDCVEAAEEVRAAARFSMAVHVTTLGHTSADPHRNASDVGRYPFRGTVTRPGAQVGTFYRTSPWLAVGAYLGLVPRRISRYEESHGGATAARSESLTSSGLLAAVVVRYEGRNVALDAGPAFLRSQWAWSGLSGEEATFSRPGAVVSAHATIPLRGEFGADLLVQHRWLGSDTMPGTSVAAPQSGWFIGLGLGIRRGR